jgi:hypothetical protein
MQQAVRVGKVVGNSVACPLSLPYVFSPLIVPTPNTEPIIVEAAREALTDMPPRGEEELDHVTLHNMVRDCSGIG